VNPGSLPGHVVALQDYQLLKCDRMYKDGGGVAIFVSNHFQSRIFLMKRSVGNLITEVTLLVEVSSGAISPIARYFLRSCTDLLVAAISPISSIFSLIFLRYTDTRLYLETLMLTYVPSLSILSKFYFFFEFLFSALWAHTSCSLIFYLIKSLHY